MVQDEESLQTVAGMKGVGLEVQVGDLDAKRNVVKIEASGAMKCGSEAHESADGAWKASLGDACQAVEDEHDDDRMTTCLPGNLELGKILENSCCRIPAVGSEFNVRRPRARLDVVRGQEFGEVKSLLVTHITDPMTSQVNSARV